jgi:glycerol-3-phosphate dehydrogenase
MVRAALRIRQRVPLVRAVNLLLDAAALDVALAAPGRSGRMLTAVPWRGRTLIGTFQTTDAVYDGLSRPSWSDMDAMLEDAQTAFPGLSCERSRVRHIHHGLTPATVTSHGASLMPDALVTTHADEGLANVISLVGVKFTTARLAAEEAVDLVAKGLDKHVARGSTGARPLPHGASANVDVDISALLKQLDVAIAPDVRAHLAEWYGTEAAAVVRFCAAERLTAPLAPGQAILEGEVAYAVRHCDAHRLADVVFRRTPLGSAGHPGRAAIHAAALVMARLLDWNDETTAGQIAEVESVYPDDATAR